MTTPITITIPSKPVQLSVSITPDQATGLMELLQSATPSAIQFPENKTAFDLTLFSLSITPSGSGKLVLSLK
jgi:hypothetical protein